jgi:hypothetical protein
MNTSESINELAAALAVAQGRIAGAVKDSSNPHFRSQYSDLASVIAAIRQPFAEHGLSFTQGLGQLIDGQLHMTTRIMHSSGQWMEVHGSIPVTGKQINAQALGSACSYMRRYQLQAMAGVPSVDDDGNAACAPSEAAEAAGISKATSANLKALLEATQADLGAFLKYLGADSLHGLTEQQAQRGIAALKQKAAKNGN